MIYLKCLCKDRKVQGQICGYMLIHQNGAYSVVTDKDAFGEYIPGVRNIKTLKNQIARGNVSIVNLKLTSDNKLIDNVDEKANYASTTEADPFKAKIIKAINSINIDKDSKMNGVKSDIAKAIYLTTVYTIGVDKFSADMINSVSIQAEKGTRGAYNIGADYSYCNLTVDIDVDNSDPIRVGMEIIEENRNAFISKLNMQYRGRKSRCLVDDMGDNFNKLYRIEVENQYISDMVDNLGKDRDIHIKYSRMQTLNNIANKSNNANSVFGIFKMFKR